MDRQVLKLQNNMIVFGSDSSKVEQRVDPKWLDQFSDEPAVRMPVLDKLRNMMLPLTCGSDLLASLHAVQGSTDYSATILKHHFDAYTQSLADCGVQTSVASLCLESTTATENRAKTHK